VPLDLFIGKNLMKKEKDMKAESIMDMVKTTQMVVAVIKELNLFGSGDKDTDNDKSHVTQETVSGAFAGMTLKERLQVLEELVNEWSALVQKERKVPPTNSSAAKGRERKIVLQFQKLISESLGKEK
jgi:hypothetical protein